VKLLLYVQTPEVIFLLGLLTGLVGFWLGVQILNACDYLRGEA
jgi:hypothetical protein